MADSIRWDFPAPADATRVYTPDGEVREFDGTARRIRDIGVDIAGWQTAAGQTLRSITVGFASAAESLTADEARKLARALTDAADEVDQLHTAGDGAQ